MGGSGTLHRCMRLALPTFHRTVRLVRVVGIRMGAFKSPFSDHGTQMVCNKVLDLTAEKSGELAGAEGPLGTQLDKCGTELLFAGTGSQISQMLLTLE